MVGKPIIKGTKITVQNILELLGSDETYQNILEAYPNLKIEDIKHINWDNLTMSLSKLLLQMTKILVNWYLKIVFPAKV